MKKLPARHLHLTSNRDLRAAVAPVAAA